MIKLLTLDIGSMPGDFCGDDIIVNPLHIAFVLRNKGSDRTCIRMAFETYFLVDLPHEEVLALIEDAVKRQNGVPRCCSTCPDSEKRMGEEPCLSCGIGYTNWREGNKKIVGYGGVDRDGRSMEHFFDPLEISNMYQVRKEPDFRAPFTRVIFKNGFVITLRGLPGVVRARLAEINNSLVEKEI